MVLFNYRDVKRQVSQIDLRKALCQFIHNYVDYASTKKNKDNDSLSKFENLIFSEIVSDSGMLPSTFDGLDVIAKLVRDNK